MGRRWHKKCNINQRRYAMTSAIAATGVPALVMAKGHKIDEVPEVPCVVSNACQEYKKTKQAVDLLKTMGAWDDVERVYATRRSRAFRNIPGVEVLDVQALNILRLARWTRRPIPHL